MSNAGVARYDTQNLDAKENGKLLQFPSRKVAVAEVALAA